MQRSWPQSPQFWPQSPQSWPQKPLLLSPSKSYRTKKSKPKFESLGAPKRASKVAPVGRTNVPILTPVAPNLAPEPSILAPKPLILLTLKSPTTKKKTVYQNFSP